MEDARELSICFQKLALADVIKALQEWHAIRVQCILDLLFLGFGSDVRFEAEVLKPFSYGLARQSYLCGL
jgi:hypothetical protein